jgi:hypothetical protein
MCVTITQYYWGCKANNFDLKECSQEGGLVQCGEQSCPVRYDWQRGVCPNHIPKLNRDKQQGARDFLAASDECWDNGEYRVRNYYVEGKPSDWHNAGNECVMQ